jgi:hypothetical protein
MDSLSYEVLDYTQYLPRRTLEQLFAQASPIVKQSPQLTKSSKNRNQQRNQLALEKMEPSIRQSDLPESPLGSFGIPGRLMTFLEVSHNIMTDTKSGTNRVQLSETMTYMQDAILHYHQNPGMRAEQALNHFVESLPTMTSNMLMQMGPGQPNPGQPGQPHMAPGAGMPGQPMAAGVRTPSGAGGPNPSAGQGQFMSPHIANLGLPNGLTGSPHLMQTHTPSPASHPLVAQHSQQGTNSSAASANTSPNVNKRRRPSTVKVEGDEAGGELNGAQKVKPSPRLGGGNKRQKPNA